MTTIETVSTDLLDNVAQLQREATQIYSQYVKPTDYSGFGRTLHAYMMASLAHVDLASSYWVGSEADQTRRMRSFVVSLMKASPEASAVLVKMWRHLLMHTAMPRRVRYTSAKYYYWLLHWHDELPREVHMTFVDGGETRILNIGLLYLLADLHQASKDVIAELRAHASRARRAIAIYESFREQSL